MKTPQLNTRPVWHKLLRKDWTPAALDELTRLVTGPFFTGFRKIAADHVVIVIGGQHVTVHRTGKIDYFAPE